MPYRPPLHRPLGYKTPQQTRRAHDQARDQNEPWRRWYKTARWQRLRERQLAEEPLCRMCSGHGLVKPATVCDHIEPHKGDYTAFWGGPFQSLCKTCHDGPKKRAEMRAGAGRNFRGSAP